MNGEVFWSPGKRAGFRLGEYSIPNEATFRGFE